MKVYIRKNKNNEFDNVNFFLANEGFKQLGYEIVYYHNYKEIEGNNKEDIVVDGVKEVQSILKSFNIETLSFDYPEELEKYLQRKIWQSKLSDIIYDEKKWNIFIKPYDRKVFNGTIVSKITDLRKVNGVNPETKIWCSEILKFVSEWRCFVLYGEILDVKRYNGDWSKTINPNIAFNAVKDFSSAPVAYALDFGVTEDGETVLIEVTEGFSVGSYGLDSISYAKFLSARWAELTKTKDYCRI